MKETKQQKKYNQFKFNFEHWENTKIESHKERALCAAAWYHGGKFQEEIGKKKMVKLIKFVEQVEHEAKIANSKAFKRDDKITHTQLQWLGSMAKKLIKDFSKKEN